MLNKLLCRVEEDEKDHYKRLIKDAQPLLLKLHEMLLEDFEKADVIKDDDYTVPNYAIMRAFKDGFKKGLTRIMDYGIIGNDE